MNVGAWDQIMLQHDANFRPDLIQVIDVSSAECEETSGKFVLKIEVTDENGVKGIIYIEFNEHCHNHYTILEENKKINYCLIKAKELGFNSVDFFHINTGEHREVDMVQIKKVKEIYDTISVNTKPGVRLYTLDIVKGHHHLRAYSRRVKKSLDGANLTYAEVKDHKDDDQAFIPIFDEIFWHATYPENVSRCVDIGGEEVDDVEGTNEELLSQALSNSLIE